MDISYYNSFSKVYDWLSPKWYYHEARKYAIVQMDLKEGQSVLNLPCGTGQNFEYFNGYLKNTGQIIGVDLSVGMMNKARKKISENKWNNIGLFIEDASAIDQEWLDQNINHGQRFDSVLCDLGLSGFPNWNSIIDNLISVLKPNGRIVIMDWYIPEPSLRGKFIKWIGKGEVNRPIYQYLRTRVENFDVDTTFNSGGIFVATGVKS